MRSDEALTYVAEFWQADLDPISKAIEDEIYHAVKEFFTSEDPDTLLYKIAATPGKPEDVHIDLFIEGRKGRESINRKFKIVELVDYELDSDRGLDGNLACDGEDLERLRTIARGLRIAAARIETALFLSGLGRE